MNSNVNTLNWFEISVSDIERARKFYETIFDIRMQVSEMMGMTMAFFPAEPSNGKVSGALVQSDMHRPSADGAKIYLNGNPDLNLVLGRIEMAGGKITLPKTHISDEIGHMAFFLDTEGNAVALHSKK